MNMTPEQIEALEYLVNKLKQATEFHLGEEIYIKLRGFDRNAKAWAIIKNGCCLNDEGEFEHEPSPSSRDEAYLNRTRYTMDDAFKRAQNYKAQEIKK